MRITPLVILNAKIFDGFNWIYDKIVVVNENGEVDFVDVLPSNVDFIDADGKLLVPAFTELQVYGSGGNLFSAYPTSETLQQMESHLKSHGTASFLACVATNSDEVIYDCIKAAKEFRKTANGFLGLHLEGPFLNPLKRGAHAEKYIRKATLDEIRALLDFADGTVRMMTIAAEVQDEAVIQYLLDNNVILSLGHSNANFNEATQAYNLGVQTTTHLFNAMSPIHHRDPGIPTALFSHKKALGSIIADGNHVDFEVIKFASALLKERLFLITDTVSACAIGPYQHTLVGDKFVTQDGTLSGANIQLLDAVKNCVEKCSIDLNLALKMASKIPAQLIGEQERFGTILQGKVANMILLNADLTLNRVFY